MEPAAYKRKGQIVKKPITILLWLGLILPWSAYGAGQGRSLKDRIRAVSNRLYIKDGRMEVTLFPLTSVSLNDAFYQKYGGGLGLAYHMTESLSLQLMGTYSVNVPSGLTAYFGSSTTTAIPYAGRRKLLAAADFCWAPVYGKISLASDLVWHFDVYVLGGAGGVQGEHINASQKFAFGGEFGVGAHVFFTRSIAMKMELKDLVLFDKVSFDPSYEKNDIQHQLMFNLGFSFFFLEGTKEEGI